MRNVVEVFPGLWRCLLIVFGSLLFVCLGVCTLLEGHGVRAVICGICGVCFIAGVPAGIGFLVLSLIRKPLLKIYSDRIESYVMLKNRYETILFSDVQAFEMLKVNGVKFVVARLKKTSKRSSTLLSSAYISHVEDLCELLNSRLTV